MPPGKGAAEAFRHAAPTIAVAGLILAGTFVSLTLAGNRILVQLGISHITQRDDGIGMRTRRAAAPCAPETETKQECSTATFQGPVPLDDPGLARVPGPGSPGVFCTRPTSPPSGIHPLTPAASGRPGRSSRSFPASSSATSFPARATGPRTPGTTDGMPAPRQPEATVDDLLHDRTKGVSSWRSAGMVVRVVARRRGHDLVCAAVRLQVQRDIPRGAGSASRAVGGVLVTGEADCDGYADWGGGDASEHFAGVTRRSVAVLELLERWPQPRLEQG